MKLQASAINLFVAAATASYSYNLNYRSPSSEHPALGLDLVKITKRNLAKRDVTDWDPASLNFTHNVASGDPYANSVILWTRIAPSLESDTSNVTVEGNVPFYSHETERYIKDSSNPICLDWKIGTDQALSAVVNSGQAYTTSDIDYTVKVEAGGLAPFTTYYYQFSVCGTNNSSPLGRTKTAPAEDDGTTPFGIAVFSCSNYPNGYFSAYGNAARKDDVDFMVHLGDYIYEYENGVLGRDPRAASPQKEIASLYDYRTRLAQYRTDPDLSLAHQNFPWIPVWDDHEVANNGYRDGFSGMNNTEESFIELGGVSVDQRKMNAVRAYFEYQPIRQVAMDDNLRIWRDFKLGKLVDLIMLDTRNYDRSITSLNWNDEYVYEISNDAGRSLMGSRQENWFYKTLIESKNRGAVWRILGSQIVFSRINTTNWFGSPELPYNVDQWDGYLANRNRTYQTLFDYEIDNNIFIAGDSHANWVSDLVWFDNSEYDPETGAGAVGVEFGGTAVSSSGYGDNVTQGIEQADFLIADNPELQWTEGYFRGYFEMHVTAERVDARFFGCPTVAERTPYELSMANFTVVSGENRLQRPLSGGVVESGSLRGGMVQGTNLTRDTETGEWSVREYESMFIEYPEDE